MTYPGHNIIPLWFEPRIRLPDPQNDNAQRFALLGQKVTFNYHGERKLYAGTVKAVRRQGRQSVYFIWCTDRELRSLVVEDAP